MELQDGFIVGIYNYCDAWCETCAFTSRCRVFADRVKMEGALDPAFKAVTEAPPLPQDVPPPPPAWLQEMFDELDEAAREPVIGDEDKFTPPEVSPAHTAIEARARRYSLGAEAWLKAHDALELRDPRDSRTVIGWFATLIPAKVHRALIGLASGWEWDGFPADHDGSAKVVLVGLDRSYDAWIEIVDRKLASIADITPFLTDLVLLTESLERAFPKAREFVRPGFDEPEDVAKLNATEGAL